MSFFLFSHDTPPTALYTFSLHDALPISPAVGHRPDGLQTRREVGVVWYRNTPAHVVVQRLPCSHRREGLRSQRIHSVPHFVGRASLGAAALNPEFLPREARRRYRSPVASTLM